MARSPIAGAKDGSRSRCVSATPVATATTTQAKAPRRRDVLVGLLVVDIGRLLLGYPLGCKVAGGRDLFHQVVVPLAFDDEVRGSAQHRTDDKVVVHVSV